MQANVQRTSIHQAARLLLAMMLAFTAVFAATEVTHAASPCVARAYLPTTDGVYARGRSSIDCPGTNPLSNSIRGQLNENYGPFVYTRVDRTVYARISYELNVTMTYNCDGHGTDDWYDRAYGTDSNGGNTGWVNSGQVSLSC